MFHLFKYKKDSGILVTDVSKVEEVTNGCAKQYICDLAIYLMTVLSSSYFITMDRSVNTPGHGKMLLVD